MRIAITGTACVGKSTVIEDFLKTWPMYKKDGGSYRIKAKLDPRVKLNKEGNEESQTIIRDAIIDDIQNSKREDNVIYDRSIIDWFAYTLWLNVNGKVSDLYIEKQIPIVKETLKYYDIIFFIPLLEKYPVELVPAEDGQRSLDPIFRTEVDNLMKAIMADYFKKKRTFFPNEDCCALIELFGTQEQRIEMIKLYLKTDGKTFGEEDSLLKDVELGK